MHVTDSKVDSKLPHLITELPGPKAKKLVERDHHVVSPSYTRDYPLVAKVGRGATVEDVDGNIFLDFAAGIAVVATGHCHPEVVAAIQKQAGELIHMSGTDFYYPSMVELAEKLASIAPGKEPKRVYFGNSGAEAIEAAIKLVKFHTKRDKLIAFHGAFHGRTMGALSLTASRAVQRKGFGTLLSGVFHMPFPDTYRGTYGIRPEHASADCLAYLENELFRRRVDPDEVATKSREFSSSRFRVKVATCPLPRSSCRVCNASAASTASCSWPMKCNPAWDAQASGGLAITPVSSQTLSAPRRGSPLGCRSAP